MNIFMSFVMAKNSYEFIEWPDIPRDTVYVDCLRR